VTLGGQPQTQPQPAAAALAAAPSPAIAPGSERAARGRERADIRSSRVPETPRFAADAEMTAAAPLQASRTRPVGVAASAHEAEIRARAADSFMPGANAVDEPADRGAGSVLRSEGPAQMSGPAQVSMPASLYAAPRASFAQMAEALVRNSDDGVELSLNPKELGKVRMTMTPVEHGMTVSLNFERTETMDLMRRHIDMLAGELKRLGYSSLTFDFQQQGNPQQERGAPVQKSSSIGGVDHAAAAPVPEAPLPRLSPRQGSGLDLRV
jgi:hypothetical protein